MSAVDDNAILGLGDMSVAPDAEFIVTRAHSVRWNFYTQPAAFAIGFGQQFVVQP